MEKILTSTALWQDFDATAEPLDSNLLTSVEKDGLVFRSLYFTGRSVADGKTRVFAKLCNKAGKNSKKALLLIDDYTKRIDDEELAFWAKNDFLVMAIDFAGRRPKGPATLYPESLSCCNSESAMGYFEVGETVRETKIYEYALNCMRAVTYLLQAERAKSISVVTVKKGARVGVVVLGTDARVTNGTVVFNSFYRDYPAYQGKAGKNGKWDGSALQKRLDYEDTRQKWLSGIAPQSYAIQAKMPVYLIVSANSPYDDATNANKMFLRLNKNSKFLLLPMVMDCLPDEYVDGIVRWCKGNYADEDIALQQFPTERGDNFVKVTTSVAPSKVSVWYSRNVNGCARNWVKAPIKKTEECYVAQLDVYQQQCDLIAFALVKGTVSVSSTLCEVKVKNPSSVKIPTRILYVGKSDGHLIPFTKSDRWHSTLNQVEYCKGYLNIVGAKGKGLATFAINDPGVRRNEIFTVSFDISSNVKQKLNVYAMSNIGKSNTMFVQSVQLVGDGKWQRVTVDGVNFHMVKEGYQMSEDENVEMLAFEAESEFMINNIFLV